VALDGHPRPLGSLRIEVPATADQLAEIRRRLLAWLGPLDLPDGIATDIVLVVNEACTNCVEHAYRDIDTGPIQVEAALDGRQIVVCIADSGVWRTPPPQPGTRGRGLEIMQAISDRVELDTSGIGTTVRMVFEVSGAPSSLQEFGSRTT
jgi:serine/threonine-protein kinase RsbW